MIRSAIMASRERAPVGRRHASTSAHTDRRKAEPLVPIVAEAAYSLAMRFARALAFASLVACTSNVGGGGVADAPPKQPDASQIAWWDPGWKTRFRITVTNVSTLPRGYQIGVPINLDAAPCGGPHDNARIVHAPTSANQNEVNRVVDELPNQQWLWFRLADGLAANTSNSDYFLYCNFQGTSPSAVLADPTKVFDLFEGFAGTTIDTAKWLVQGNVSVAASTANMAQGSAIQTKISFSQNVAADFMLQVSPAANAAENFFVGFHPNDFIVSSTPVLVWYGGANGTATNDIHTAENPGGGNSTEYGPSRTIDTQAHLYGIEMFADSVEFRQMGTGVLNGFPNGARLTAPLYFQVQNNSPGPISISAVRTRAVNKDMVINATSVVSVGAAEVHP
jgi:hypothetical protein